MAAKRKKAPKKKGSFFLAYSSCGDLAQVESFDDKTFPTVEAARAALDQSIKNGEADPSEGVFFVAQVVDVAESAGIKWTGKTNL